MAIWGVARLTDDVLPVLPACPAPLLQAIIIFMHGMLLPCWCIVVLRWGKVL